MTDTNFNCSCGIGLTQTDAAALLAWGSDIIVLFDGPEIGPRGLASVINQ
jgi:hypothetical protein